MGPRARARVPSYDSTPEEEATHIDEALGLGDDRGAALDKRSGYLLRRAQATDDLTFALTGGPAIVEMGTQVTRQPLFVRGRAEKVLQNLCNISISSNHLSVLSFVG